MVVGRILIAAALVAGAFLHPPTAHSQGCDARWQSCQTPRWCDTTGTLLPPFGGYCPVGPRYASPPWGDDDE
jgi:hypothetical protein